MCSHIEKTRLVADLTHDHTAHDTGRVRPSGRKRLPAMVDVLQRLGREVME